MNLAEHEPVDEELWRAWVAGDQRAGAKLVGRHYASVDRFFRYKVGEHGVDLTQATFLALQEASNRDSFRGESGFRTWLFGIARNKLLRHLYKGSIERHIDDEASSIEDLNPSVPTLLDDKQSNRLLLAALRRLPLDTQLILELHYWEEMKVAEIAEVIGKPPSTVKTLMRRGRQRLEELMDQLAQSVEELESTLSGLEGWAERVRRECDEDDN